MSQLNSQLNLEKLEKDVMDKANFYYICKYHGGEHMRKCIREAFYEITKLNEVQTCKLFGVFSKDLETIELDFEDYIEKIYQKMLTMGAV